MRYIPSNLLVIFLLLSSCDQSEGDDYGNVTLTEADLEPGQAGVRFLYTPPDKNSESVELDLITNKALIYYDEPGMICPPGWGLKVPIESDELAENGAVFLWFNDTDSSRLEMADGESEVYLISVDIPSIENGGQVLSPIDGSVMITETTGTRTSGRWHGNVEVSTAFYAPDAPPSGEIFHIKAFVFNAIETQLPSYEASCKTSNLSSGNTLDGGPPVSDDPCGRGWPSSDIQSDSTRECTAIYNDLCFESDRIACACAGCDIKSCNVNQTYPAQVMCEGL